MDVQAPPDLDRTPTATKLVLVAVLGATALALLGVPDRHARTVLIVLTGLFMLRVAGQLLVLMRQPSWLPPMRAWNFVPYVILLPIQLALIAVMCAICAGARFGPLTAIALPASLVYWGAMGLRFARRMWRNPDQRWFGGTIPIVFHCVLAAFLFALGSTNG
jgi:uncharacterized protein